MIIREVFRNWAGFGGDGYLGGNPPVGEEDGRAKIQNQPAKVLVSIYQMKDALSVTYVGSVLSAADGTWRIEGIDRTKQYRVIGADLDRSVNSAIQDWIIPAKLGG